MGYDEVPLKVPFENLCKTNEARKHVSKLFHMQAPQFTTYYHDHYQRLEGYFI